MSGKRRSQRVGGPSTLHDVARLAGVSTATASRVLNGSDRRVTKSNELKVRHAATMLQYAPNESAQSVARGRTQSVGLVVRNIAEPYFASIASGVIDEVESLGMHVSIAVTSDDLAREVEQVRMFRRQRAAAIILVGSRHTDEPHAHALVTELRQVEDAGGRVVMLSKNALAFNTVAIDNRRGAADLAEMLVTLGYDRFLVIAGPAHYVTARDRTEGFHQGLSRNHPRVASVEVIESGFDWAGGYEAAATVASATLTSGTAVLAVNDLVALGLLTGLRERGIEVPRDVALTGYDDISTLRDVRPGLTTVRIPLDTAGRIAARVAIGAGSSPQAVAAPEVVATEVVATEVVVRESTPRRLSTTRCDE